MCIFELNIIRRNYYEPIEFKLNYCESMQHTNSLLIDDKEQGKGEKNKVEVAQCEMSSSKFVCGATRGQGEWQFKSDLKIMPKTNNITCYTRTTHTQTHSHLNTHTPNRSCSPAGLTAYLFNQHSTVGLARFFGMPLSQIKCGA